MSGTSWGAFKTLEKGLGLDSVIKPQSFDFMGTLNKGASYLGGALDKGMSWANKNSDTIGALGGLYGAYSQHQMGQDMYKLQKDAYNYNKMLSEREKKRQEEAEMALAQGFNNSGFGVA
jgi:hypothetical protein